MFICFEWQSGTGPTCSGSGSCSFWGCAAGSYFLNVSVCNAPNYRRKAHTHPQTHTLAVAVYTQQKESAALLFFYFYAAPRPRLELPQRTGASAPGRRALRVCQCVLAQRVGGLTKAGWAGAVISFSPRPCAELGSSWKNAPPSPGVSSASAPCKSPQPGFVSALGPLLFITTLARTDRERSWLKRRDYSGEFQPVRCAFGLCLPLFGLTASSCFTSTALLLLTVFLSFHLCFSPPGPTVTTCSWPLPWWCGNGWTNTAGGGPTAPPSPTR